MNKTRQKNYGVAVIAGGCLFIVDILSKIWATGGTFKPVVFIDRFFYLNLQKNSGIAFGIPLPLWGQLIGSVAILVFLIYLADRFLISSRRRQFLKPFLFGIIMGGALGNLVNRVILYYVIDFIILKPFPNFNIADIGVTVGLVLLFVTSLADKKYN